jgi:hypothetical protein
MRTGAFTKSARLRVANARPWTTAVAAIETLDIELLPPFEVHVPEFCRQNDLAFR